MKWLLLSLVMFTSVANAKNTLVVNFCANGAKCMEKKFQQDDESINLISKDGQFICIGSYKQDEKLFKFGCSKYKSGSTTLIDVPCETGAEIKTSYSTDSQLFVTWTKCESKPNKNKGI